MSERDDSGRTKEMAKVSDTLFVERAKRGDARAFEALIRPHLPAVRRLAQAFTRDASEADDLAQDALIRAFRSIGGFEGRSAFTTWLYVVIRSAFLDGKRSRKRPERYGEDVVDAIESEREGPEASLVRKDENARLWAAIGELDETFRVPLVLFSVEGMSYEEIAAIESVPIGTVRSRIARARAALAEILAKSTTSANRTPLGTESTETSSNPQGRPGR